jgi:hypothetical protein
MQERGRVPLPGQLKIRISMGRQADWRLVLPFRSADQGALPRAGRLWNFLGGFWP